MSGNALGDDLVEAAFAAAIDETLWPAWLQQLASRTGANGVMMARVDSRVGGMALYNSDLERPRAFEEYFGGMQQADPQIGLVFNPRRPLIYANAHRMQPADRVIDDYMDWQTDRLGWASHVTFASLPVDGQCAALAVHFGPDGGAAERSFHSALAAALPSISGVFRLAHAQNERLHAAYWEGVRALHDEQAVFLINDLGRVARMNSRAEAMLSSGLSLSCVRGRLGAPHPALHRAIEQAIASAIRRIAPQPAVIRLAEGDDLVLDVLPIAWTRRLIAYGEPAAIVVLRTARPAPLAQEARWRSLFGLTPMEARVAELIRTGRSPDEMAERLAIRVSTVRHHIKAIQAKTDTHRLAELASLLANLSRLGPPDQ